VKQLTYGILKERGVHSFLFLLKEKHGKLAKMVL